MIPSWLIIGFVAFALAFVFSSFANNNLNWFNNLRRPSWLTFEKLIPVIWIFVFTCGVLSATLIWNQAPGTPNTWLLMGFYLLLEIVILLYTPVMCFLRSLTIGTIIGGVGFILGLILAIIIFPLNLGAGCLLLPYLLWSPVGTFVTWKMIPLNPNSG